MEETRITLTLGDWLYNAGVVGIVNILEHAGEELDYNEQEVSFKVEALENFEDKFFNYFIDKYEKNLAWYKIISFRERIDFFEKENYKNFDENSLEELNNYIDDAKNKLKSNSHKAAYELIDSKFSIIEKEKNLKKVKLKKNETIGERIGEIKESIENIREIIEYYSLDESRKYIAGKNIVYTIIKNAWNGVSFLNPQTKEKNMYFDYKNYFPIEAKEYINSKKEKYKFNCFTCDNPIVNLNTEMNFLNATGFDTSRKPSHVWNFNNDIAICPICKLVYSCVPAGFTYVYDKGIFVNDNHTVKNIVDIAKKISINILKYENMNSNTTFKSVITALTEEVNEDFKYEVADIQVVRYESEKYKFNILSKNILKVIRDSKEDLNKLIKASYKEVDIYFRVYEELVKKLFNNGNQFLLIHKLFIHKLTKPKDSFFGYDTIQRLIRINFNFLKGVGYMPDKEKEVLKSYRGAGYYLRQEYKKKGSDKKLEGISYKLLNSLKTNNSGMFMDVIINSYLYAGQQIPSFFTDCLKSNVELKTIGYAFVSGLVDGEDYKKNNEGGNN